MNVIVSNLNGDKFSNLNVDVISRGGIKEDSFLEIKKEIEIYAA